MTNKSDLDSLGRRKKPVINNSHLLIRLPIDLKNNLELSAVQNNMSVSALVRDVFIKFLATKSK